MSFTVWYLIWNYDLVDQKLVLSALSVLLFLPFWSGESFPLHKTINLAWSFCLFSRSTSPTRIFSRIPRSVPPRNVTSRILRRRKTHASFWMNMPSLWCCRLNKMTSVILLVLKLRHSVFKVLWIYERRNHYNYCYFFFKLISQRIRKIPLKVTTWREASNLERRNQQNVAFSFHVNFCTILMSLFVRNWFWRTINIKLSRVKR